MSSNFPISEFYIPLGYFDTNTKKLHDASFGYLDVVDNLCYFEGREDTYDYEDGFYTFNRDGDTSGNGEFLCENMKRSILDNCGDCLRARDGKNESTYEENVMKIVQPECATEKFEIDLLYKKEQMTCAEVNTFLEDLYEINQYIHQDAGCFDDEGNVSYDCTGDETDDYSHGLCGQEAHLCDDNDVLSTRRKNLLSTLTDFGNAELENNNCECRETWNYWERSTDRKTFTRCDPLSPDSEYTWCYTKGECLHAHATDGSLGFEQTMVDGKNVDQTHWKYCNTLDE